ncbi:MAG: CoA ester lyase [Anaerolineales bacterium]|nr:CoA ester lyase [Anaerolineales bacterium]MCB9129262.1 CoA ester lyase [Ardenticatenales bacterium]MCB9171342.1 CoA ester lyase [Ardenticatenales bacterium]
MIRTHPYRVRRACLYMPGDSMRKISKAAGLAVDTIIIDLEDGLGYNQKDAGRTVALEALQTLDFGHNEVLVRANGVGTGRTAHDILATFDGKPDGYVIPKVENAEQVVYVDHLLRDLEATAAMPLGTLTLHAIVESARGIVDVQRIAAASPRLTALQFGAEDLAGDMGLTRTAAGHEVFHARSSVVLAAKANGLQAIDGVYLAYQDEAGAYAEAKRMAEMGFEGKMAIHPRQLDPFHRAFTPSDDEIAAAQRLVEAHEAHQQAGVGAFVLDGKMIDPAIVKPAEQVLAKARAAGKIG